MSIAPNDDFIENGGFVPACPVAGTDARLWRLEATANEPCSVFMEVESSNLSPSILADGALLHLSHTTDVARHLNSTQETCPDQPLKRGRRPNATPLIGNNRHGRHGKLRCEQCRSWKQKVFHSGLLAFAFRTVLTHS